MTKDAIAPDMLRELIRDELGEETLLEGMALYSGIEALKKGKFYILGYNPADRGGNYTHLLDEKFKPGPWSAYYDQCWHLNDGGDCGCVSRGQYKIFQKRTQELIGALHGTRDGSACRATFATNAIFLASGDPFKLGDSKRRNLLWEKHWRIHLKLISIVQPDFIIALGCGDQNSPYGLLRQKLRGYGVEMSGSGWKSFEVPQSFRQQVGKREPLTVVGLYHPSRFAGQANAWSDFLNHQNGEARIQA